MRKLTAQAEAVDGRRADGEAARDLGDAKEILSDPSWTRRFVFVRCGMEDAEIRLWYRPE